MCFTGWVEVEIEDPPSKPEGGAPGADSRRSLMMCLTGWVVAEIEDPRSKPEGGAPGSTLLEESSRMLYAVRASPLAKEAMRNRTSSVAEIFSLPRPCSLSARARWRSSTICGVVWASRT